MKEFLAVVHLLGMLYLSPTIAEPSCEVEDSNKVDCGITGTTQKECEASGCCWKEASSDVPWCYYPVETSPQCQNDDRVECGYYGIDQAGCELRGCCWSPTTATGQPWCYQVKALDLQCQINPEDRSECGYLGICAERCNDLGCCWSPTNNGDGSWCYKKQVEVTATPGVDLSWLRLWNQQILNSRPKTVQYRRHQ